jgi:hypothetical protein
MAEKSCICFYIHEVLQALAHDFSSLLLLFTQERQKAPWHLLEKKTQSSRKDDNLAPQHGC